MSAALIGCFVISLSFLSGSIFPKFLKSDDGRRSINTLGSFASISASTSTGRAPCFAAPLGEFLDGILLIGSRRVVLSSDCGMTLVPRS